MEIEKLKQITKNAIAILSEKIVADHGKYVMANSTYIQVADGKGLNGTNIAVRCATSTGRAVCFDTREEAYRSGDYYLKNGAGQPILLVPTRAEIAFADEISKATEMLDFIDRQSTAGNPNIKSFEKTEYLPEEGSATEPCFIIETDNGRFRIIPIYCNLDGEQQVELQKQWYDSWIFVSTHAHVIDDITEQLAYEIICKSVDNQQ